MNVIFGMTSRGSRAFAYTTARILSSDGKCKKLRRWRAKRFWIIVVTP